MTQPNPPAPGDKGPWDLFISYARDDNLSDWITHFIDALVNQHAKFANRTLKVFFDKNSIQSLDDWRIKILDGINRSHVFLAFVSPKYFASEWCRKEWKAWIDHEIAAHTLSNTAAPIYIVEVPGLTGKSPLSEHEVAQQIANLCPFPDRFQSETARVIRQIKRRQFDLVQPFYNQGANALQRQELIHILDQLAHKVESKYDFAQKAQQSPSTVFAYNPRFTGRLEELLSLREKLIQNQAGVVVCIHGLGGIGKTELAYTYAHAFAGVYPGGRFHIPCENAPDLRNALYKLDEFFHNSITDEERKNRDAHHAAILRCLRNRLENFGAILLVLDNVANLDLLSTTQTQSLSTLGKELHLLATTRLSPTTKTGRIQWFTLNELPEPDAVDLMDKFRPFQSPQDEPAAQHIVQKLGGFTLAIELAAAYLAANPDIPYTQFTQLTGLDDLTFIADEADVESHNHDHEKSLSKVLAPTLKSLTPPASLAMQYASILPPDAVALPWLQHLVAQTFPEMNEPAQGIRLSLWHKLQNELWGLALLVHRTCRSTAPAKENDASNNAPDPEETFDPRLVRVHRLIQQLVWKNLTEEEKQARQSQVDALIQTRNAALENETHWQQAAWELIPFEAMAWLRDETNHPERFWLCCQAGHFLHHLAQWNPSESLYRRALAIIEASFGKGHSDVASALNNLAVLLKDTNRLSDAEPLFRRALAIEEANFGKDHPDVSTVLNNLVTLLHATNRLSEAEPLIRRALAIDETSFGKEHPNVAGKYNNIARLLKDTNRLSDAESFMRRALAIDEASFGNEHPNVARDLNNLAQLLQNTNRLSEAEPLLRRALTIYDATFGQNHPEFATALNNLAMLLNETGRHSEAERLFRQALAIDEAVFGQNHPNVARNLDNLAQLLQDTNRLSEAERLFRRALAIEEVSVGAEHPEVAIVLNNLALLLKATNRLPEAEPLFRRALAIDEASFGNDHPEVAKNLNNLARLLHDSNRRTEAEPLIRRALSINESRLVKNHPDVATTLNNLAQLFQETNRLTDAEPLMRRALEILAHFQSQTGHQHPHFQAGLENYRQILQHLNYSKSSIAKKLQPFLPHT